LIAAVLIVLAFGAVHIAHGSSTKKGHHHGAHHRSRADVCRHAGNGHVRHVCARRHPHAPSLNVQRHKPAPPSQLPVHRYGAVLAPALDHARHVFDSIANTLALTDDGSVGPVCGGFETRVSILTDEADGVPHAGAWYLAVPALHRQVMGVYHNMAGALEECRTGSENGDGEALATARSDVAATTSAMRHLDDYSHWLGRQRP